MPIQVKFSKSKNPKKKYMAVFSEPDGRKIKTTHFGSANMSDYTINKDPERRRLYLVRHKKRENWSDYKSAGALSRWILWEHTSLQVAKKAYAKRFNLKLI